MVKTYSAEEFMKQHYDELEDMQFVKDIKRDGRKDVFDFIDKHKVNQGSHFMLDEEDYQRFKKDSLNSKKVTLWCSEHGDQEGNVCKKCLSIYSKKEQEESGKDV